MPGHKFLFLASSLVLFVHQHLFLQSVYLSPNHSLFFPFISLVFSSRIASFWKHAKHAHAIFWGGGPSGLVILLVVQSSFQRNVPILRPLEMAGPLQCKVSRALHCTTGNGLKMRKGCYSRVWAYQTFCL